ncbi:uncharacterized protein LOC100846457 [Brachypodium distachyon]|uniref:Right handed beta helix domain-containing protein n=1 Tax=Brachypodium distachyon TaxID=15368 RepID=I1IPC2_BRADI|nr:uncharacterized protein LOC100846457 [Brachypodium distachyon]KQJ89825.1 hypothetical protein BRADI_4g27950v3 [Brachypodium distachyon]|eukprot:XP_010238057.1 uncharacterized protein LOC100846457 [Brachypodium distachyon]
MVAVGPITSATAAHHVFTVVIDGAEETSIHEGVIRCSGGGTLSVASPGVLEVSRLKHVAVRGGGGGDVRFARCGFASAEACGAASFHRCDAVRAVDVAGGVSVRRCRSADVERAGGAVSIRRCKGAARVHGAGGELRVARCREADVGGCPEVSLGRCREARVDWCGALGVQRCRSAEVSRCGAVRVDRCGEANVWSCGNVIVRRGKVNVVEAHQPQVWHQKLAEPAYSVPTEIMTKGRRTCLKSTPMVFYDCLRTA